MLYQSVLFMPYKSELFFGTTSKQFGVLCFDKGVSDRRVIKNRKKLAVQLGIKLNEVVLANQIHSDLIYAVSYKDRGSGVWDRNSQINDADSLITDQRNCVLVVKTADCVPVSIFDPVRKAIAVIHAGWKGCVNKNTEKTIEKMRNYYKCKPRDMLVSIGPCIHVCHYDVSEVIDDRIDRFMTVFQDHGVVVNNGTQYALNLPLANKLQCLHAGIPEEHIEVARICTYENEAWPSYRRDLDFTFQSWTLLGLN